MSIHPHRREGSSGWHELLLALAITACVMVVEIIAGLISGSLALLADAMHMLTDVLALGLSLFAAWITTKPATTGKTFGYYRTEILAALINGVILWLLVIWIFLRALQRVAAPSDILTGPMLAAAVIGLLANLASGRILFRTQAQNLNVRGAWLNVIGDAVGSIGVITAGLLIRFKGWRWADPVASMGIGVLIAVGSWMLIKRSVNILLEGSPAHVDVGRLIEAMRQVKGVREVHDLHLWTITTGMEAMSGHIVIAPSAENDDVLEGLNRLLATQFGIHHTTFQLEPATYACDMSHASPAT